MSKKGKKDFEAGDFIFAKVKGYPAWPARIRGKNGKKFFVYFYGTGETANLMANVLYDYKDNKDKFLAKPMKRRDFNDGLLQINYDIENNVPLPAEGEEPAIGASVSAEVETDKDDSNAADSTMEVDADADTTLDETAASAGDESKINDSTTYDTTQNDTAHNDSADQDDSDEANPPLVIDEDKKTRKSKAPVIPRAEASKAAEETAASPATGRGRSRTKRTAEDSPTVVATPAKKRRHVEPDTPAEPDEPGEESAKGSSEEPNTSDTVLEDADAPERDEAESEATVNTESLDVPAEVVTPKPNKGGRPKTLHYNIVSLADLSDLKEPFKDVLADDGKPKQNVLLVRLPKQRYVGIKLFQDRPKSFKTPAVKLSWECQMAQNAIDLRHKLENGLIKPSHIPNELVTELNLTEEDKKNIEKEKEIEEKRYRLNFLRAEMKLGELTAKIKCNLGLQNADTKGCLALMEQLLTLEIKPLMLYKNHKIVETIKRLRSYVGDTHNWTMTEEQLEQFTKDASRIRKKAEECYQCFKLLFPEPAEGVTFFQQFSHKHGLFHACTKALSQDEMLELVHEPAEMLDPNNPIQPILQAMNEDDDEEVPKKRRKITDAAKSTPGSGNKGTRGRPSKNATQREAETIHDSNAAPSDTRPAGQQNEGGKEKEVSDEAAASAGMDVDESAEPVEAEKDKADATLDTSSQSGDKNTDKSNDKGSNKSVKQDKASSKSSDSAKDKEKDKQKHSRTSDKVTEKSSKSRSDDSHKHSSSKHPHKPSDKDGAPSKSSDKSDRSDKSGSKSDKAKSDGKSVQDKEDKSDKEDTSALKRKQDADDKAGTSNGSKDSERDAEKSDERERERDGKRERSNSAVNGESDRSVASKANKIKKSSSSSSSHDSGKYSSKKKSIK